jgi:hypothetical protein
MRIGQPGFGFLIVESLPLHRFVQAMGEPEALIIEVCGNAGVWHPDVWRLRRDAPLPHAPLDAQLWDGGMDARCLFTAAEAAAMFREWLRGGERGWDGAGAGCLLSNCPCHRLVIALGHGVRDRRAHR